MYQAEERVVTVPNLQEYFRDSIDEALCHQKVCVDEHTSHYVVNLLTVFSRSEDLYESTPRGIRLRPLALMLSDALEAPAIGIRNRCLRRLGDVALFISGFFSDSLATRPVDVDYYVSMGGNAYLHLSESLRGTTRGRAFGEVFRELADKFHTLVDVLNEVSDAARGSSDQDVLRLYDVWLKTGSRRAEKLLRHLGIHPLRVGRSAEQQH